MPSSVFKEVEDAGAVHAGRVEACGLVDVGGGRDERIAVARRRVGVRVDGYIIAIEAAAGFAGLAVQGKGAISGRLHTEHLISGIAVIRVPRSIWRLEAQPKGVLVIDSDEGAGDSLTRVSGAPQAEGIAVVQ